MDAWRARVLAEAEGWLRTPWAHRQRCKGAGVDCGHLLLACYIGAGLVEPFEIESYPADWMLHRHEERFLGIVERYLDRIDGPPLPADVVVWRYGRCFSHGAIVIAWPRIIHAYVPERAVVYGDATKGDLARAVRKGGGSLPREARYYSLAGRI